MPRLASRRSATSPCSCRSTTRSGRSARSSAGCSARPLPLETGTGDRRRLFDRRLLGIDPGAGRGRSADQARAARLQRRQGRRLADRHRPDHGRRGRGAGRRPGIRPARIPSPAAADPGRQGRRRLRLALCRQLAARVAFLAHDGQQGTDAVVEHRQQPLSDRHGNLLQDGPLRHPQAAAIAEPVLHLRAGADLPPGPMGARIYEVPISYNSRTYLDGKKIRPRDGLLALGEIFRCAVPRPAIYRPRRLLSPGRLGPGAPLPSLARPSRSSPSWVRGCWRPGRASALSAACSSNARTWCWQTTSRCARPCSNSDSATAITCGSIGPTLRRAISSDGKRTGSIRSSVPAGPSKAGPMTPCRVSSACWNPADIAFWCCRPGRTWLRRPSRSRRGWRRPGSRLSPRGASTNWAASAGPAPGRVAAGALAARGKRPGPIGWCP